MDMEYQEAVCLGEKKRRFRCRILINGKEEICYVPCSSRLSHYINMDNVKVLVTCNKAKNSKTKYRLYAVKNGSEWIVVDMILLNKLVEELYRSEKVNIKTETMIDDTYKADILVCDDKQIIEVKGLITTDKIAFVPMFSGERAIRQLNYLNTILKEQKYKVSYTFVLLSRNIKTVQYNFEEKEYQEIFSQCIKNGMKINCYYIQNEFGNIGLIPADNIAINL